MAEPQGFSVNDFGHLEEAQDVKYGIYDTQDNCWLGDENGPRLYTLEDSKKLKGMPQQLAARIAAQMTAVQLGYPQTRLVAREFKQEELVLRDSVDTKMTAVEALRKLENGE